MKILKLISAVSRSSQTLGTGQATAAMLPGRRFLCAAAGAAATEKEYARRNYANNVSEYNTVIDSISAQRRYALLRDVYDDMALDGVKPTRDTFHSLIAAAFKGNRLQDSFFFVDQMKSMGLVPDVTVYNILISSCGKCKNSDKAIRILDEMKVFDVKPSAETYVCLLNACATEGRLDRVYAIIRDMTAAGLGLNKFCYAGLINAYKNKRPVPEDFATKIIEFVERSKEWTSVEAASVSGENFMMGILSEEFYNLPTAEYAHRRGFLFRDLVVYHAAFHACADLNDLEVMETLLQLFEKDGKSPDTFTVIQIMRCYLNAGELDRALKVFEDREQSRFPTAELYTTLVEGAMNGYTPKGMQIAQETLEKMNSKGLFLTPITGSNLLLKAAREKTGGYVSANYIWDMMRSRKMVPLFNAVEAYYNGLKGRDIPEDDPRLQLVSRTYDDLRSRFANNASRQSG